MKKRMERRAGQLGLSVSSFVAMTLDEALQNVELTSDDHREIAEKKARNIMRQRSFRTFNKA
ncbi:MAG: hypothetical protein PHV34_05915 [Verrucomicrobiae bacterium]|nr:hypothetical protein [Verrucomicrobiae bacterium]